MRVFMMCLLSLILIVVTPLWPQDQPAQILEGVVVGATCPITWVASSSPNLKEYHLYVSQVKGNYTAPIRNVVVPVPTTQSTCTALNLTADGQYYMVATVVGTNGAESVFSNEVAFVRDTIPPAKPNPPTGLVVGP